MNPSVFDMLENYYRPKRQLRITFMIGGLVLFALGMAWAASMWINGIDQVPTYVCSPGSSNYADCVRAHQSRAGEFAEARALGSLIPLAIGALFGIAWFPIRSKDTPPLVRLIRERPLDGVWIYPLEIRTKKHGQVRYREHRVIVATVQRKKHEIDITEDRLPTTMATLSAALPHATVGYSDQLQAQFVANPDSLRRPVAPGQAAQHPQPMPPQAQPMPPQAQPMPPQAMPQPHPVSPQPYLAPQQPAGYPQPSPYPQHAPPYPGQLPPHPAPQQAPQYGAPQQAPHPPPHPGQGWPPRR